MSWVTALARPEILALTPYEHALWEPELTRLHANELPWRPEGDKSLAGLNRYPEPQAHVLASRLASLYDVSPDSLLVGRGSDEGIDLLVRAFCRAGQDSILVCPPTFGMYALAARIQGASVRAVPLRLDAGFALDEQAVLEQCTPNVKLVFLCSPNNPTGNLLERNSILRIGAQLAGKAIVVVDEAYVEFAAAPSLLGHRLDLPNLVVLRTLSKAYALAGARCGVVIGSAELISLLRKVIPPYAIAQPSSEAVLQLLGPQALHAVRVHIELVRAERGRLLGALPRLVRIARVWPSDSNFILAELTDAAEALVLARRAGLLVRDVRRFAGLDNALRITIGTREQNDRLLEAWRS